MGGLDLPPTYPLFLSGGETPALGCAPSSWQTPWLLGTSNKRPPLSGGAFRRLHILNRVVRKTGWSSSAQPPNRPQPSGSTPDVEQKLGCPRLTPVQPIACLAPFRVEGSVRGYLQETSSTWPEFSWGPRRPAGGGTSG